MKPASSNEIHCASKLQVKSVRFQLAYLPGPVGPLCMGALCIGAPCSGKPAIGFSPAFFQTTTPAMTMTIRMIITANQVGTCCFISLTPVQN